MLTHELACGFYLTMVNSVVYSKGKPSEGSAGNSGDFLSKPELPVIL
jgi:hypothetical protein